MRNIYYEIWVDAIVFEKTKHGHLRNWKTYTMLPISILQGVNLLTVFFWLAAINIKIDIFFDFNIFPGKMIDGFISGFSTLFLPFIILNYLLIFRNNRHQHLIKKYNYKKGKFYLTYFLMTFGIFIIPLIIGKFIL